MLSWLRAWKERRRLRGRLLFRFWDGTQIRRIDPFLVIRRYPALSDGIGEAEYEAAMAGKEPATTRVLGMIGELFGVKTWDEATATGMTSWEMLRLLREFEAWMEAVKKNTTNGRTSLPSTD
jgi:hypothetical protein